MLRLAEIDLEVSKIDDSCLFGFCWSSSAVGVNINELDELIRYKPDGCYNEDFWFDIEPNGPDATKRIDILKEIINTMTNEKTQKYQNS